MLVTKMNIIVINIRHQHNPSPTSVTNIDVTRIMNRQIGAIFEMLIPKPKCEQPSEHIPSLKLFNRG